MIDGFSVVPSSDLPQTTYVLWSLLILVLREKANQSRLPI
ncbi:unnamed protein product [Brassica rapa]|uniref:Uncharacterized protein n=1 Tax=Brassica campestris TaxID=3711 RepID=A0A8D9HVF6_BRACM|nr:unnamed protein product [Brassica rapa]